LDPALLAPVLVVESRVFVRLSAERLTVVEGLPVRSTQIMGLGRPVSRILL
jgi:hypothetical protein